MKPTRLVILSATIASLTFGTVGAASAATVTPTPADRSAASLSTAISRVDHRITIRLDLLNKLVSRLNSDTRLNANDKTLLLNEDQAAISGLTALKSTVDAETTAAGVNTEEQQIVTYHVFDVLGPQNRELIAVDNLEATAAKTSTTISDLQNKVTALQGQGVNGTEMQAVLTDASTRLQTINGELATDQSSLEAITPATAGAATTFQTDRNNLSTVRTEFKAVRVDFEQLKDDVKTLHPATPTVAPTPTP